MKWNSELVLVSGGDLRHGASPMFFLGRRTNCRTAGGAQVVCLGLPGGDPSRIYDHLVSRIPLCPGPCILANGTRERMGSQRRLRFVFIPC